MSSNLNESPQLVYDLNTNVLDHHLTNKKMYKGLNSDNQKRLLCHFKDNPNYPIYYVNESGKNLIYCLNHIEKYVEYYMEYQLQSCNFIDGDWITQLMLWRNGNKEFAGMTDDVVYDILLPLEKVIMTDTVQTIYGKFLWNRLIRYAFKRNLNVYLVNFIDESITEIKSFHNFQMLCEQVNPWLDNEFGQSYRFAISDKVLKRKP